MEQHAREEAQTATRSRLGAHVADDGVTFGVWAPHAARVAAVIETPGAQAPIELEPDGDGLFFAHSASARADQLYRFRLDGGPLLPDPASRFQPHGPHGASQIIDARAFAWTDSAWSGIEAGREVIYEMHAGTFTPAGTWAAATAELERLAALGMTLVEIMPVADFPGAFGWGYDGVSLFAPYHGYGTPDELRAFVDRAHALGIGVLFDVVYNHFGPDGNHLPAYTKHWLGARASEWGDAPNFDAARSEIVREFYAANAAYWVEEFHADGLRFDATQQIHDASAEHVLRAIIRRAREAAPRRRLFFAAENEVQQAQLVRRGGVGCDVVWNDDFHHVVHVALTGRREAYYSDYEGVAREIVAALRHGFLYQGQRSKWIDAPRGTPALDLAPTAFVHYLENHDQVANSARGERLVTLVAAARLRAATALLLLAPQVPLIFQGQEYGSTRPFLYFADHDETLARAVRDGRAEFLSQFPSIANGPRAQLADPAAPATFAASRLDPLERDGERGRAWSALFADLLRLRRDDGVVGAGCARIDAATLSAHAFAVRFFGHGRGDRLLIVNLGPDLRRATIAEPLLAPPWAARWVQAWSSEEPSYGGSGGFGHDDAAGWRVAADSALLLRAQPAPPRAVDGAR